MPGDTSIATRFNLSGSRVRKPGEGGREPKPALRGVVRSMQWQRYEGKRKAKQQPQFSLRLQRISYLQHSVCELAASSGIFFRNAESFDSSMKSRRKRFQRN